MKTYVVGNQNNRLNECPKHMFKLMGKKIITISRSKMLFISPYARCISNLPTGIIPIGSLALTGVNPGLGSLRVCQYTNDKVSLRLTNWYFSYRYISSYMCLFVCLI